MGLVPTTKTVGVTLKFVIEGDEELTQRLLDTLPGDLTIGGASLAALRLGVRGREVEPVRVWIQRQDVSIEREDDFLENA
jgi:hypothetical protein